MAQVNQAGNPKNLTATGTVDSGVVNNVLRDLWDGPTDWYVFPASPIQMRVVSSSVKIPEKTDVKMLAISDNVAANVIAMGAIMGWFEDN